MRRLSPSSQLVLLAVALALLLSSLAGLARVGSPSGTAVASQSAEHPEASLTASPTPSPPRPSATPSITPAPDSNDVAPGTPVSTRTPSPAPSTNLTPSPSSSATAPAGWLTLAELLGTLPTAPEQRAGYDRSLFRHWIDADGDGCDTRREVLIEESLTAVAVSATCGISSGSWVSLYDGLVFTDPSGLDIDHVVALAEAWDSGAYGWSADRRERFANDLGVSWSLIAVSASSNRSKSDQDPADWLPPSSGYLCPYLADWLVVKVRWSLSVDAGERAALVGLLDACPDTRRPVVLMP